MFFRISVVVLNLLLLPVGGQVDEHRIQAKEAVGRALVLPSSELNDDLSRNIVSGVSLHFHDPSDGITASIFDLEVNHQISWEKLGSVSLPLAQGVVVG